MLTAFLFMITVLFQLLAGAFGLATTCALIAAAVAYFTTGVVTMTAGACVLLALKFTCGLVVSVLGFALFGALAAANPAIR